MKRVVINSIVALLIAMPVYAEVIQITAPTDDSRIKSANPTINFGTESYLGTQWSGSGYQKGYMRFDTSSLQDKTVGYATLELVVNFNNVGVGSWQDIEIYGLDDATTGEDTWTDAGITWNNAPGNVTNHHANFTNATFLGQFHMLPTDVAGTVVKLAGSKGSALATFLNADSNNTVTIMINSITGTGSLVAFASKEDSVGPYAAPKLEMDVATTVATTAEGNGADARIHKGSPDTLYGTDGYCCVTEGASSGRKGYMKFDLGDVSDVVTSATVRLWLNGETFTVSDYTVKVYGLNNGDAGENWDETTITWNNAPQNDTTDSNDLLSNTTYLGSFNVTNGTPNGTEFNFSSDALATFIKADTDNNATLILTHADGAEADRGVFFATKEFGTYPGPILFIETRPPFGTIIVVK